MGSTFVMNANYSLLNSQLNRDVFDATSVYRRRVHRDEIVLQKKKSKSSNRKESQLISLSSCRVHCRSIPLFDCFQYKHIIRAGGEGSLLDREKHGHI